MLAEVLSVPGRNWRFAAFRITNLLTVRVAFKSERVPAIVAALWTSKYRLDDYRLIVLTGQERVVIDAQAIVVLGVRSDLECDPVRSHSQRARVEDPAVQRSGAIVWDHAERGKRDVVH
jgi:hypothetical protein